MQHHHPERYARKRLRYVVATGEANGLPIVFREDGYINMTKAAKHFDKRLQHFWDNEGTHEYVQCLAERLGLISRNPGELDWQFGVRAIDALCPRKVGRYGGTFCHPKLAVFFARWLDVRFAVWCDLMIDNILRGNIQTSVVVPTKEAIDVEAVVAPLKAKILELETNNQRLEEELKGGSYQVTLAHQILKVLGIRYQIAY